MRRWVLREHKSVEIVRCDVCGVAAPAAVPAEHSRYRLAALAGWLELQRTALPDPGLDYADVAIHACPLCVGRVETFFAANRKKE